MTVRVLIGDCREVLRSLPTESVHCVVTLTETQVAYIAGLIDGEGSLESQRQKQKGAATWIFTTRLSFTFGTAEPITTVAKWLGGEPKVYPATSPNRQPRWRFHIRNRIALPLLRRCLPHLILKRRQAETILEIDRTRAAYSVPRTVKGPRTNLRMPQAGVDAMQALHDELRSLKSNKRPLECR